MNKETQINLKDMICFNDESIKEDEMVSVIALKIKLKKNYKKN